MKYATAQGTFGIMGRQLEHHTSPTWKTTSLVLFSASPSHPPPTWWSGCSSSAAVFQDRLQPGWTLPCSSRSQRGTGPVEETRELSLKEGEHDRWNRLLNVQERIMLGRRIYLNTGNISVRYYKAFFFFFLITVIFLCISIYVGFTVWWAHKASQTEALFDRYTSDCGFLQRTRLLRCMN